MGPCEPCGKQVWEREETMGFRCMPGGSHSPATGAAATKLYNQSLRKALPHLASQELETPPGSAFLPGNTQRQTRLLRGKNQPYTIQCLEYAAPLCHFGAVARNDLCWLPGRKPVSGNSNKTYFCDSSNSYSITPKSTKQTTVKTCGNFGFF